MLIVRMRIACHMYADRIGASRRAGGRPLPLLQQGDGVGEYVLYV